MAEGVPVGEAKTAAVLKKQLAGRSFKATVNINRR
jgi:hypothetical protein